jgi:7-keto-8-aminopelargonate synthetase-like enzyme
MEKTYEVIKQVFDDGYFVNTCAFPAVPKHKCGLRVTITRHVTKETIDGLIGSIKAAVHKHSLGISA